MPEAFNVHKVDNLECEVDVYDDEWQKSICARFRISDTEDVRVYVDPDGTIEFEHKKHDSTVMFYKSPHPLPDEEDAETSP